MQFANSEIYSKASFKKYRCFYSGYMLLVFLAFLPQPLAAYLDPGTGSMLFSALVGLVSTLYFTLRSSAVTLRLKLAGLLLGRNKTTMATQPANNIVFFSEGRQYWNCFSPILQELETRQIRAIYWTMDPEDPGLDPTSQTINSQGFKYIETRFIGKGYTAFAQMNALKADICIMTTPGLDVLQIRRSKKVKHYSHIIHALDDLTTYRVFGTDYFDSVLLSGEHQIEALEGLEAVRNIAKKQKYIIGCTYLDVLQQKLDLRTKQKTQDHIPPHFLTDRQNEKRNEDNFNKNNFNKDAFCVLVAPSWGPNGLLAKYGTELLFPLLEAGYQLIVRPHPQSRISEADLLSNLQQQLSPYTHQFHWDFEQDNIHALLTSDVMISDFSSVIYDYVILMQKPAFIAEFTFNYDGYDAMDLLPREPWTISAAREVGIPLPAKDIGHLPKLLPNLLREHHISENAEWHNKLSRLRNSTYQYPGEAGQRAVDCILKIRDSL